MMAEKPFFIAFGKKLMLILLLSSISSCSQSSTLSLMTYNIRLDIASDGENAWPHRKKALINQINFYEPSIFGIQEGLPHQVDEMKQMLSNYEALGSGRDGGHKGEYSALFYLSKDYEVLQSDTFWLSLTPNQPSKNWDAALPRICTYALFREKVTGIEFWVFNTHFDHIGVQSRLHSIDIIFSKIQSLNTTDAPVFLMGDLNVEPNSEVIAKLSEQMLDSFDVSVATPFGPNGTFNGFKFHDPVGPRLDYIFVSQSYIEVLKYAVLTDSKDLKYTSDHFPVYIEVAMY